MTSSFPSDEIIKLEAPGEFLSELLAVSGAGVLSGRPGHVRVTDSAPGCWRIVAPLSGQVRVAWEDSAWVLTHPQAAVFPGSEGLSLLPLTQSRIGYVLLCGDAASRVMESCQKDGGLFFDRGGLAVERALRLLSRGPCPPKEASDQAFSLLMSLHGAGSAGPAGSRSLPLVVEAALGIMRREYAFLEGIGELAERLEVSQEYLTRSFCRYMGITPGKYLNQIRIENAKLLLREGRHSVGFVSGACGFANSNYFARVFRAAVGMNPREYALSEGVHPPDSAAEESLYVL